MKRPILAAAAAALLFLSACASSTLPADVPVAPENPETSAVDTQSTPEDLTTLPAEDADAKPVADGWLDEPQTVQHDIEEVVTYTLRIPHLTLASDTASDTINDSFSRLLASLEAYAEDEIYPSALDAQTMAFVNGDYTISMEDGTLTLAYALTVRYGADGADERTEKTYTFDAATGERLAE